MSITSQNEADAIVVLVAAEAPAQIDSRLVLGNLVHRDYAKTAAEAGDAVNVTPIANAPQPPPIVLKTEDATFQIPDVTKALAVPDLLKTYMQPAIIAIVEKIETDIASLYSNFTYNTAVGGAATISEAVVDSAETALFGAKVPPQDPKFLVVNAGTFGAMRQVARFTEFQTVGFAPGGPNGTNEIIDANMAGAGPMGANGKLKDFLVFRSQFILKPSTTTYNMGFHRDALGLAVRRLPLPVPGIGAIAKYAEEGDFGLLIVMSSPPPSFVPQITVACLYGCAVICDSFGIQVQSNN